MYESNAGYFYSAGHDRSICFFVFIHGEAEGRRSKSPTEGTTLSSLLCNALSLLPLLGVFSLQAPSVPSSPLLPLRHISQALGYGGGDEAKMLRRHLAGSTIKVCIGADRRASAA
ncbi:uncharacterized protein LOC111475889 [Cucurbita maxima]|uniref:Uncharacterized protein LOC111475889 n=1 Tax=Cucurbita maxima TaxID=3661 RepID=A0A6J1IDU8_CUCMA|nr:uncharacterized protein LOC111475889 [Cucurbita maxima]